MNKWWTSKMSKWEFLAWILPFVWIVPPIMKALGFGFVPSVFAGLVLVIPAIWLAKKVVRPEDLK